jgi:hypothetical protein
MTNDANGISMNRNSQYENNLNNNNNLNSNNNNNNSNISNNNNNNNSKNNNNILGNNNLNMIKKEDVSINEITNASRIISDEDIKNTPTLVIEVN